MIERLKRRARQLKREVYALYLAYRDPRVPWYARLVAGLVVAYAFSPLDLIPDFIPIVGYLDDLVLIPAGIESDTGGEFGIEQRRLYPMRPCRAIASDSDPCPTSPASANPIGTNSPPVSRMRKPPQAMARAVLIVFVFL